MYTHTQQNICGGHISSPLPHGFQELTSGSQVFTTLSNLAEPSLLLLSKTHPNFYLSTLVCFVMKYSYVVQVVLKLAILTHQALDG